MNRNKIIESLVGPDDGTPLLSRLVGSNLPKNVGEWSPKIWPQVPSIEDTFGSEPNFTLPELVAIVVGFHKIGTLDESELFLDSDGELLTISFDNYEDHMGNRGEISYVCSDLESFVVYHSAAPNESEFTALDLVGRISSRTILEDLLQSDLERFEKERDLYEYHRDKDELDLEELGFWVPLISNIEMEEVYRYHDERSDGALDNESWDEVISCIEAWVRGNDFSPQHQPARRLWSVIQSAEWLNERRTQIRTEFDMEKSPSPPPIDWDDFDESEFQPEVEEFDEKGAYEKLQNQLSGILEDF